MPTSPALLTLLFALILQASTGVAPKFDSNRAWEHLRQMVAIGPRPAGSAAIERTRKYIKDQLTASGLTATEQAWDDQTPAGRIHMVNLIVTIPGASKERLIIAGHYDTKRFRDIQFVGASDGASSAAFLIEIARVLKARRNALTIELLFLDGEEAVGEWQGTDHTYGSRYYVKTARANGTLSSIKALILVDMIGDRDLQIKKEQYSTPWLNDIIWAAAQREKLGQYFRPEHVEIEDDHLEFRQAGVPAVDLIDLDYPAWHTELDNLERVGARSLQIVGDVVLAALPDIEKRAVQR
jgi:glutaminyl-peptide cyclotransferase